MRFRILCAIRHTPPDTVERVMEGVKQNDEYNRRGVFDRNGGYEGTLNYAADPDPPLFGADKDWAEGRLHEKGLRPPKKRRQCKGK